MRPKSTDSIYYVNPKEIRAKARFCNALSRLMEDAQIGSRPVVLVCIGSDRVTGDSLGPLVGYKLSHTGLSDYIIYGTLDEPVHALNLEETIAHIKSSHPGAFIIAIDASLGTPRHLGYVTLGKGPLRPGAGVDKELSEIGDLFITGIVNVSGSMEQLLLQTTRLAVVMRMADFITSGLTTVFHRYQPAVISQERVLSVQKGF